LRSSLWPLDAELPAAAAHGRLEAPFDQVEEEDRQAADELPLFRLPHAFDFLGDVLKIRFAGLSRA